MPVSRRLELIRYAAEHKSLIIEDDLKMNLCIFKSPRLLCSAFREDMTLFISVLFQASSALYPGKLYDTSPGTF